MKVRFQNVIQNFIKAFLRLLGVTLLLVAFVFCADKQPAVLPAHAHNDYEHEQPLVDALARRFKSVEADVYSIGDSLFVAHDFNQIKTGRTLRQLYLDPLQKQVEKKGGSVYGENTELILFVDIKDNADSTYQLLHNLLKNYSSILTRYENDKTVPGAVMVVVSGNRPLETMKRQTLRYAFYDGRLNDLNSKLPSSLMPVISDNWNNHFLWKGEGAMAKDEKDKLTAIVAQAKQQGYLIRFWATPDPAGPERESVWNELRSAGVGLIGTDDLDGLKVFFHKK